VKFKAYRLNAILKAIILAFVVLLFIATNQTLAIAAQPQVAAGGNHTVGLKSDGTLVAVGRNDFGQLDVGSWTDIVQVVAGAVYTLGLKSDGSAVG